MHCVYQQILKRGYSQVSKSQIGCWWFQIATFFKWSKAIVFHFQIFREEVNLVNTMGETATKIGVSSLMSYCDDLVKVLQNKKDINNLMQCSDSVKLLRSSCDGDFSEIQNSLEVYQKKIDECQQRITDAKSEIVSDAELDSLQKEYKEELNRESSLHEKLSDKINDLEQQRVSIVEREQNLKKADKDEFREQRKLSMYASVTNIIPNMDTGTKISGHIVEREKRTVEMFEFETTDSSSSIEICNSLWKMINS